MEVLLSSPHVLVMELKTLSSKGLKALRPRIRTSRLIRTSFRESSAVDCYSLKEYIEPRHWVCTRVGQHIVTRYATKNNVCHVCATGLWNGLSNWRLSYRGIHLALHMDQWLQKSQWWEAKFNLVHTLCCEWLLPTKLEWSNGSTVLLLTG